MDSICVTCTLRQVPREDTILDFSEYYNRQMQPSFVEDEGDDVFWAEESEGLSRQEKLHLWGRLAEMLATGGIAAMALAVSVRVLLG